MTYSTLKLEQQNQIATITLTRPEKRNAISSQMIQELMAAFDEAENGSARVVIITGSGKSFCAGMDLDGLRTIASNRSMKTWLIREPWRGCFTASTNFRTR